MEEDLCMDCREELSGGELYFCPKCLEKRERFLIGILLKMSLLPSTEPVVTAKAAAATVGD